VAANVGLNLKDGFVWDGSAWQKPANGGRLLTGPTSAVVTAVTGSTAHTKGAWVELFSATPYEADFIGIIYGASLANQNSSTLIDIGVGASGSETVIVGDVAIGGKVANAFQDDFIPVRIPAGSRVAVRVQGIRTSYSIINICMKLFNFNLNSPTSVDTLGTSTTTSTGTSVGTSWTQIAASTSQDYQCLVAVFSLSTNNSAAATFQMDVGTGPAGSEQAVITAMLATTVNENIAKEPVGNGRLLYLLHFPPSGVIPAGTRIVGRRSASLLWLTVIGVPFP
jgi:hypothetical protein